MSGKEKNEGDQDKPAEKEDEKTAEEIGAVIDTLKKQNPAACELLAETVVNNVLKGIRGLSVAKFQQQFPDLYKSIAAELGAKVSANLNVDGFLLDVDDPFAAGALRVYGQQIGIETLRLPFVLPKKEKKASAAALESYIVRAEGGVDKERAAAARKILFEIAPEKAKKKK